MHHLRSVHGSEILAPGTSKVLLITNTPKKHHEEAERMLDPIDSSTRSHQDEGNSKIIDRLIHRLIIIPISLIFFNQLRLRQR
jgi:hypothetical protein